MLSKKRKLKGFLRGAGSVLELYPHKKPIDIGRDILKRTPDEAIEEDWRNVGSYIWNAVNSKMEDSSF